MKILAGARNHLGPLAPELQERIRRFIQDPSPATWDDIHGIMVAPAGRFKTIWKAVIAIDPTFPKAVYGGSTVSPEQRWQRVPDVITCLRAIRLAIGTTTEETIPPKVG